MSTSVDTTTKLSYLLPTGTFLTFQVLAPLATNNGKCGLTEQVLTAVTLAFLVVGCVAISFTDSYTGSNGKVYNGFLTYKGLWVPGYDGQDDNNNNIAPHDETSPGEHKLAEPARVIHVNNRDYITGFKILRSDYLNAALSAIAFLTLTMFTDPVCTCFYPHLSETILKTMPVLLATALSFCCSFTTKIRHGYGNSVPRIISQGSDQLYKPVPTSSRAARRIAERDHDSTSSISVKVTDAS